MDNKLSLVVLPRKSISWSEFIDTAPRYSIALDGVVNSGPKYSEMSMHANFDHHVEVVREATMSTSRQVYMAIKGGLMGAFRDPQGGPISVYVNDCDQDTALAYWFLRNHRQFEGTAGNPAIHALLDLTDKLDITGGCFPLNIDEQLSRRHNWVFAPYADLRKSGALATANESVIASNLDSVCSRITQLMLGKAQETAFDTRHEILYTSPHGYKIVNEIGGTDARGYLFSQGMHSFISLIRQKADTTRVWTVGKQSRYVPQFPVSELYDVYNEAEGLTRENGWNGSDIIGGNRNGSRLDSSRLAQLTDDYIKRRY